MRRLLAQRGLPVREVAGRRESPEVEADGPVPLSAAQRRSWFLQHLAPESVAYNLSMAFDLRGPLRTVGLRQAFAQLVGAHEVLRTVYPVGPSGEPWAEVVRKPAVRLPVDSPDPTHRVSVPMWVRRVADTPFDLALDLPLRHRLLRLSVDHHVLALVMHHIAVDEDCWPLLFAELAARYANPMAAPAPVDSRYADYARAEHARQRGRGGAADLEYWTGQLTPLPPLTGVPGLLPRPAAPTGPAAQVGATVWRDVSGEWLGAVGELGRAESASPFMVLLAGYLGLLHRYTGERDIAVAVPVSNRHAVGLPGLEKALGNFGNTVVIRVAVPGRVSFRELVGRVRDAAIDAFAHQGTPLEQVVAAVRPERTGEGALLARTMFSHRVAATRELQLDGLRVEVSPVELTTARFDLVVEVVVGERPAVRATYREQMHTPTEATRLLGHFTRLVAEGVAEPDAYLSTVDYLSGGERGRLVAGFNRTDRPELDRGALLHDLVGYQARERPDAVAVVCGRRVLSYAELDAASARLAARLAACGAGPETFVGIHLERSIEQVVGLLGVLKAGAAFVPLETTWPVERLAEVVSSAAPVAVLTVADGRFDGPCLNPADDLAGAGADPAVLPGCVLEGRNLAYAIYTSGSTGVPKGAMIEHRSISHRLAWQAELLGLTPDDAVLYKAPLGFDISINEIFLPLAVGARLVLAEPGGERDPDALITLVAAQRVSFAYLTSSLLAGLLERPDAAALAGVLRHVWCGGEVLTPVLFDRFREVLGDAVMYHGYGPAEATIGVSCEVYRGDRARDGVTIGRPNANTRIYVLDAVLSPMPVGVPGELYIAGVPLARGYLNDPRRTATRFVANPFDQRGGGRLYATGDLARYREDGVLEFLGRTDRQVKIAGRRIELGEIESALQGHPEVGSCLVLEYRGVGGNLELAAFAVAPGYHGDQLTAWLHQRLPDYAVPRTVLVLDAMPMLPSGKVDAAALRARLGQYRPAAVGARPRTPTERTIAGVWARVLETDSVDVRANFFDLGGYSLLVPKLATATSDELGRVVRVIDVFLHPTVAALARLLDAPDTGSGHPGPESTELLDRAARTRRAVARRQESRARGEGDTQ